MEALKGVASVVVARGCDGYGVAPTGGYVVIRAAAWTVPGGDREEVAIDAIVGEAIGMSTIVVKREVEAATVWMLDAGRHGGPTNRPRAIGQCRKHRLGQPVQIETVVCLRSCHVVMLGKIHIEMWSLAILGREHGQVAGLGFGGDFELPRAAGQLIHVYGEATVAGKQLDAWLAF